MGRSSGLLDVSNASQIQAEICRVKLYSGADIPAGTAEPVEHPTLFAQTVEWRGGAIPGQAHLALDTLDRVDPQPALAFREVGGAAQLQRVGRRVSLALDQSNLPLFHGTIVHQETDLAADRIEFTALDDRWLLAGVPVYGCIVADPTTGALTFAQGWPLIFNPDGMKNCRDVDGRPVFTHTAEWNSPAATTDTPEWGEALAQARHWTVADVLSYLRFAYFDPDAAALFIAYPFLQRAESLADRIDWPDNLHALLLPGDPAFDPANANRTPRHLVLDGLDLAQALETTLAQAGPYTLGMQPVEKGRNRLSVLLSDRAAAATNVNDDDGVVDLPRPFNGDPPSSDPLAAPTAGLTGGVHHIDLETTCQSTVTMGDRVRLESRFAQTGPDTGDLVRAWTDVEETAFKAFLATASDPLAALHAAMRRWPRVGQAYRIAESAAALDAGGVFAAFPRVAYSRTPDQALLSTDPTSDTLKRVLKMPISVETREIDAAVWHAALVADGLTIDSMGTILLPGLLLADGNRSNHNGSFDADLAFRLVRINCAVPLDHAVTYLVSAADTDLPPVDSNLAVGGIGGSAFTRSQRAAQRIAPGLARQQAIRTHGRYQHEYRYNAWPIQADAGGGAETGLYQSDLDALGRAAREQARVALEPRIAFAPELAGISPGLTPGLVIRQMVEEVPDDAAVSTAPPNRLTGIDAVIDRVIFDFAPKPVTRVYSR